MKLEYDVVIVGSGAGGGTIADRLIPLAKQGAKIAILESGPYYPHEYFTQREVEMLSLLRNNGAWPTVNGAITVAAGDAVGGSTLMYTGVTFKANVEVIRQWGVPNLTPEDLKPRFAKLWKEIHVIEPQADMINDNNKLFKKGCDKLGWETEKIHLNLKDCKQEGFCNIGCATGGKQGTLEVQLPKAVKAGIEIIPNFRVDRVNNSTVYGTIRKTPPDTKPGKIPPGDVEIKAKRIILAAGSPGSPAILIRSGFDKKFSTLGRYITVHPALTVYGEYPKPIKNYKGFPKTYYTPRFSDTHGHYIETAFYYPFVSTKHLGLWGANLRDAMKKYNQFMCMIILNHDKAKPENMVVLDKQKNPHLKYELSPESIKSLCHAQAQATRILFAAGCQKAFMPCADKPIFSPKDVSDEKLEQFISPSNYLSIKVPIASAHPQGGCRMGYSIDDSVTDSYGQVHGYPWLYVADASLFPQSSHVNPFLTVMALADRVAENLINTSSKWG
jgi:choline dehydrogenase-like flavoprotein